MKRLVIFLALVIMVFFTLPFSVQSSQLPPVPGVEVEDSDKIQTESNPHVVNFSVAIPWLKGIPPHPDSIYWISIPARFCVDESGRHFLEFEVDSTELFNQLSLNESVSLITPFIGTLITPFIGTMTMTVNEGQLSSLYEREADGISNHLVIGTGQRYLFWTVNAEVEKEQPIGMILPGAVLKITKIENGWLYFELLGVVDEPDHILDIDVLVPKTTLQCPLNVDLGIGDIMIYGGKKIVEIEHSTKVKRGESGNEVVLSGKIFIGGGWTIPEEKNIKIEPVTPVGRRKVIEQDIDGNP